MTIITTIGTSLVTNTINPLRNKHDATDEEKRALDHFLELQQKDFSQKENCLDQYDELKEFIRKRADFSEKTSAEVKSIINIRKDEKFINHFLEIELVATDSILAPLCAEILKVLLEENLNEIKVNFDNKNIIKDLQVGDYKKYKQGLINLLNRLNQFAYDEKYFDHLVLNITGGFKGIIPYLTIYGQVNNVPLYYIFEFTNALIKVPQIPITVDKEIFEKEWQKFYKLDRKEIVQKQNFEFDFLKIYETLLEIEDDMVTFNALGKILWDKYKIDNFIFFSTKEIIKEIRQQPNISQILKNKFQSNYQDKTEQKNNHYVYDDGNNPYRIFNFENDGVMYIYKTFENHDKYEKYIDTPFDKSNFIAKATLEKI